MTWEAEDFLRGNLINFIRDSAVFEILADVLCRIIDFRDYEDQSDDYKHLFSFYKECLRVQGSSASQIVGTLDVTRLSDDDLGGLLALKQLNWGVLNESVCRSLIVLRKLLEERQRNEELRHEVEEQRSAIRDLGQEVSLRQNENAVLRARNEDQGCAKVELEVERERQEGMIVRQGLEIERLKVLNQKREDEQNGLITSLRDANEVQKREVAKQRTAYDELHNEVVRLKEEMKRVTSLPSS
jgi:hypothetical protein